MTKSELANSLFHDEKDPYNCAQSVLCVFAEQYGLTHADAKRMAARFGRGMSIGSTCGTVTGALMVLGLAGADPALANKFTSRFAAEAGSLRCPDLLIRAREAGEVQKDHCSRMIALSVSILEDLLTG